MSSVELRVVLSDAKKTFTEPACILIDADEGSKRITFPGLVYRTENN